MKILVLTENYPNNNGGVTLMYVHTRNLYYQKHGIGVDNLSFSADRAYIYEGISVITLDDYKKSKKNYDILVVHAANIKHHYRFLKKYGGNFKKFLFFFHGHEVLKLQKVYSKPYPFVHENGLMSLVQNIYDDFKLFVWKLYYPKVVPKSWFIFVSEWMLEEFEKWTKISREKLNDRYSITYNCVGQDFEENSYDEKGEKKFDFVTIRGNLDGSKYSIDIVNRIANNTPEGRFLVVGKGSFFSHYKKAKNIEWWDKTLSHNDIIKVLDLSRYALMPTRTDAQGLMMCEMAAYGIPVITSDIPVCHEIFDGFSNVTYIDNRDTDFTLNSYLDRLVISMKDTRYYMENTISKELKVIESLIFS